MIAIGGGAFMSGANRRALGERGLICYLDATPPEISRRIRDSAGGVERPLLGDGTLSGPAPSRSGATHRMPQGVTLWGRLFDEGTLLAIGMALEAEFDLGGGRPPTG